MALLFLVIAGVFLFRPEWITYGVKVLNPTVLFSAEAAKLAVAPTVDDGPDGWTKAEILAVL